VRVTAVRSCGGGEVHLGIDRGPSATAPLCPVSGLGMRTTAIHAATCRACIATAVAQGLPVDGLVLIPETIRRQIALLRAKAPEALAAMSDTELMLRLIGAR